MMENDPDAFDERAETAYNEALEALSEGGLDIVKTVTQIAIDGVWPLALHDFVWNLGPKPNSRKMACSAEMFRLRAGLDLLADHWKIKSRNLNDKNPPVKGSSWTPELVG